FFVSVFGTSGLALSGWSLVCSLIEVGLVFTFAHSVWGRKEAIVTAVLMAIAPLHVTRAARTLADAPLAALFSLAFVSFFFAERRRPPALYIVAGLAAGFSWWVKSQAAIPFFLALMLYALVWRRWRLEWLLTIGACGCAIALEFTLFWAKFGDPLFAIKAM